ncbi:CapA family protein [Paenibacillus shunpengii]|uniref:CapA family protein n=1 Tax=Paenibacillus shunpengii TaxID=2054424 RepID=A0ABW5SKM1_9BACL
MLPSRSEKHSAAKKAKQRRRSKMWVTLNVVLILCIAGIIIYFNSVGGLTGPAEDPGVSLSSSEENQDEQESNETGNTAEVDNRERASSESEEDNSNTSSSEDKELNEASEDTTSSTAEQAEEQSDPKTGEGDSVDKSAEPADGEFVVMSFAGDVQFSGKVEELLEREGFDYPYLHLGNLFKNDDLTFINLETPVTTGGEAALGKSYVYKSSPKALEAMKEAGVDIVNLANNHILDQGQAGLADTLKYLKDYQINYVGAGLDRKTAYAPVYYEVKGMRIALLGFTRVIPEASWRAESGKPGVADAYNSTDAVKAIGQARKEADLVIVMSHWGEERQTMPNDIQTQLGHEFIDAGADLVIGGHPHVLQGLESYKGKWIAYSTGNFIFSRSTNEETWRTAVFQARCQKNGACTMKATPYHAELGQPVPMENKDGAALLKELELRSFDVKVGADGSISAAD